MLVYHCYCSSIIVSFLFPRVHVLWDFEAEKEYCQQLCIILTPLKQDFVYFQLFHTFLAVLDFMNEEAIDDAWLVASYLGDADTLISSYDGILARHNDAENILHLAAASVAVRGVLFGNSHPLSSRWFL